MCTMLLWGAWAFLLLVVHTEEGVGFCCPVLHLIRTPLLFGCWLHAHSFVVNQPIVGGVTGLQVTGLAAVHLLIPLDQEVNGSP